MAARDTFVKEPPMPKGEANKLSNGDLESKNPLWLKDKGDSFFHDKNHLSAIEAYTCLLYTSPSPRDQRGSRMPSSA